MSHLQSGQLRDGQGFLLHRAVTGSTERFLGVIIEHFAGAFPAWLAPVQVAIVYVADRQQAYARQVEDQLRTLGFRAELDDRGLTMQKKIAEAAVAKIPFTLVIGDREVEQGTVAPRRYGGEDLKAMPINHFVDLLTKETAWPASGKP